MPSHAQERDHGLDGLRAAMMLLGVLLHAGASFSPQRSAWPYQAEQTSLAIHLGLIVIHLFRMPTFFVMAGYFAALLYRRRGVRELVRNRIRRVAVPFAVAWVLLYPLWAAGVAFANAGGTAEALGVAWRQTLEGEAVRPLTTMHLWFLCYLLVFYAAAVAASRLPKAVAALAFVLPAEGRSIATPTGIAALGTITALLLVPMTHPGVDAELALLPVPRLLAFYGLFFAAGWWLFERADALPALARRTWRTLSTAVAFSTLYLLLLLTGLWRTGPGYVVTLGVCGLAIWAWVFGLIGYFLRYRSRPTGWQVYGARASYWIYLVHVVVVIWTAAVLRPLGLGAFAQFGIVFGSAAALSVLSYHWLVRDTVIGEWLNGRRRDDRPAVPATEPQVA